MEERQKLLLLVGYHLKPVLPEQLAGPLDPNDMPLIRQLQEHLRMLAREDQTLGGRLGALSALMRLQAILKDYTGFEEYAVQRLDLLRSACLYRVDLDCGSGAVESLYDRAKRILSKLVAEALANNQTDDLLTFTKWQVELAGQWWTALQLSDGLIKRPGLDQFQRYQALALRAVALDRLEGLLASLSTVDDQADLAQGKWVLSMTSRAAISRQVDPAVRQAVLAWEGLGPARFDQARPLTVSNMPPMARNLFELPDPTPLQEISAMLDQVVRKRTPPNTDQPARNPPTIRQPQRSRRQR